MPGHAGEYILFHSRRYENNDSIDVLYTLIDMNADSGLGKVPEKNVLLEYGGYRLLFRRFGTATGAIGGIAIPEGRQRYLSFLPARPGRYTRPLRAAGKRFMDTGSITT